MPDLTVTINPPDTTSITIGGGIIPHNFTHAPGGSDSLAGYYASNDDLLYVSGQVSTPSGVVFISGNQNISGTKNFLSRPSVTGIDLQTTGEFANYNLWGELSGALYPYPKNDLNRSWLIQEKAEQIAGISGDTILFANPQWTGSIPVGTGINSFYNTGFWARQYDWSCVAVRASRYTSGSPNWASTLITPRHIYGAKHVVPNIGDKMAFVSNVETGYTWEASVSSVTNLNGDAFIATLNTDAPSQIRPAKILGAPPSFGWEYNLLSNTRVFLTKENKVWAKQIGTLSTGAGALAGALSVSFNDPSDARYTGTLAGGDSSNGLFLPLDDGSLVLLGAAYSTSTCTFAADTGNLALIRAATTGYALAEHQLTARSVSSVLPDNKVKYLGAQDNKWNYIYASTVYADSVFGQTSEYYVDAVQEYLYGGTTHITNADYKGLTLNTDQNPAANTLNFSGSFLDSFHARVVIPKTGSSVNFTSSGPTLITPNGASFSGAGYIIDIRATDFDRLLIQPISVPSGTYAASTGSLTGAFYPLNSNPSGYVMGSVVRPSNTGNFVDTGSVQTISGAKIINTAVIGFGQSTGSSLTETVLGGSGNSASGIATTVLGGTSNSASGTRSTTIGGQNNIAFGSTALSIGGFSNTASGSLAISIGGQNNYASGTNSRVFGGNNNVALNGAIIMANGGSTGRSAGVLVIGSSNDVFGIDSIALGFQNTISGQRSVGIGRRINISNENCLVLGSETGVSSPINSSGDYSAIIHYTGGIYLEGPTTFNARPTFNGTGFLLSGEASAANTGYLTGYVQTTQTGQFYPINNPSGYITGVNLSSYATTTFTTGISGYQSGQINSLQSATGNINTRVTTVESATGSFALSANTGAFLTTGAADNRYASQSSTGAYTGQFYPRNSNPSGYITGVDLSTYATQSYVNGVSGYLYGQITGNIVNTGSLVGANQTGAYSNIFVNKTGDIISGQLSMVQTSLGTGAFASGLILRNPTAAVVGGQQSSPSLMFCGNGWKTTATAASQSVDIRMRGVPMQSTAAPNPRIHIDYSINSGAYVDLLSIYGNSSLSSTTLVYNSGASPGMLNLGLTETTFGRLDGYNAFASLQNYGGPPGLTVIRNGAIGFGTNTSSVGGGNSVPVAFFTSSASATIQMGADHASTATSQTFKAHNVTNAGTTGASLLIQGGSGAAATGTVTLQGGNRAAFVANATTGDLNSIVTLLNALKATVISHGLMSPS